MRGTTFKRDKILEISKCTNTCNILIADKIKYILSKFKNKHLFNHKKQTFQKDEKNVISDNQLKLFN